MERSEETLELSGGSTLSESVDTHTQARTYTDAGRHTTARESDAEAAAVTDREHKQERGCV